LRSARFAHRTPTGAQEYWIARSSWATTNYGVQRTPSCPSVIRPQIICDAVGGVEGIEGVGIAIQQRAGLGLVIRRHIVSLLQRLTKNIAVGVIGLPGADEDADAMLRLGIEIAHIVADLVHDKMMRRQRAHGFLPGRIVGEPHAESG